MSLDADRRNLVKRMLEECGLLTAAAESFLHKATFASLDDGGMGSFSVEGSGLECGVTDPAETSFYDSDGIQVIVALIVDDEGLPIAVDFWKTDSSPLISFPDPASLVVVNRRHPHS